MGGFTAIDAVLDERVAWTTALKTELMSTLGVDVGGEADGSRTVGSGAEKACRAEMTGDTWSHDFRGNCFRESDKYVMSVVTGRLQGSWICQSAA